MGRIIVAAEWTSHSILECLYYSLLWSIRSASRRCFSRWAVISSETRQNLRARLCSPFPHSSSLSSLKWLERALPVNNLPPRTRALSAVAWSLRLWWHHGAWALYPTLHPGGKSDSRLYGGKSMPKSTHFIPPTRVSQPSRTTVRTYASRQHPAVLSRTSTSADPGIMSILWPKWTCNTDMSRPSPTTRGECGFLLLR